MNTFRVSIIMLHPKVVNTQCGYFSISLSVRFYVKSISENLEVIKTAIFAVLVALNCVYLVDFKLQKVQKIRKIQIQSL